jgi:hypothetical protein
MRYEEALRREAAAEPLRDCACDICGMSMESRGFEEIGVVTQMGAVTLGRRYYICPTVGHGGYAPFDRLPGLHNHASKGMQDWICYAAAKEAFAGATETLAVFSGVALSHATVQEVAQWHGQQVDAAQKALVERVFDPATRPAEPKGPDTLYVEADGAPGLWNLADEHFSHAVHILDFYHASEHIHAARLLQWPDGDEEGKAWASLQAARLKAGAWDAFINGFDDLCPKGSLQCGNWNKALAYFENRRDHMHYDRYLAMGLYIGSGMVESGCKLAVTQRMKLVGAHWGDPGAHDTINLRANFLNGAFRPAWIAPLAA